MTEKQQRFVNKLYLVFAVLYACVFLAAVFTQSVLVAMIGAFVIFVPFTFATYFEPIEFEQYVRKHYSEKYKEMSGFLGLPPNPNGFKMLGFVYSDEFSDTDPELKSLRKYHRALNRFNYIMSGCVFVLGLFGISLI